MCVCGHDNPCGRCLQNPWRAIEDTRLLQAVNTREVKIWQNRSHFHSALAAQ